MRHIGFLFSGLLLSALVSACAPMSDSESEADETEDVGTTRQAITFSGLKVDAVAPGAVLKTAEHCLVPASLLSSYPVGQQVRLTRTVTSGTPSVTVNHLALCTVKGTSSTNRVQMTSGGLTERLGATAGETSVTAVTMSTLTDGGRVSTSTSTIADTYDDDLSQDIKEYSKVASFGAKVVYLAPHGRIEKQTAEQVAHIRGQRGSSAFWTVGLHTTAGTIARHLHITSNDISPVSFPGLAPFMDDPMRYAVSFHGFDDDADHNRDDDGDGDSTDDDFPFGDDVLVGGRETLSFRHGVSEIINDALAGTGFTARHDLAGPVYSKYSGDDLPNVVNRAAEGQRGLQLEQSLSLRDHATAAEGVADAVMSVYDCVSDAADTSVTGTGTVQSDGTSYLDTRLCPRFIAQYNVPTNIGLVSVNAGKPASCTPGRVHVDVYRLRTSDGAGTWERIGGGFRNYDASCTPENETGFEPATGIATPANVRVVVKSLTAAGAADVASVTLN